VPEKANLSFHKPRFDAGIRLHQTVKAIRKRIRRDPDYFLSYLYLRGFLFVCWQYELFAGACQMQFMPMMNANDYERN
jgi:hypothetical protein